MIKPSRYLFNITLLPLPSALTGKLIDLAFPKTSSSSLVVDTDAK
ncbi:MAG: Uncharacterised protein [Halieaceae bacterium]|nr:MAG: Uncharacterised protein [Halieaceae bacterium]